MSHAALLAAMMALAIDRGWGPGPDGETEFIIQIPRAAILHLAEGEAIRSEMPPQLAGVRRYRIQVGSGPLPRIDPPIVQPPGPQGPDLRWTPPESEAADRKTGGDGGRPASPTASHAGAGGSVVDSTTPRPPRDKAPEAPPTAPSSPSDRSKTAPPPAMPDRYSIPPRNDPPPRLSDPVTSQQAPPGTFSPESSKPLAERTASFRQDAKDGGETKDASGASSEGTSGSKNEPASPPYLPLTISLALLLGSLTANVYLGVLWVETRRRFQRSLA